MPATLRTLRTGLEGEEQYSYWLFDQDPDLPVPKMSRRDVVEWILAAEANISVETRRNAWRKTGYAYFSD